MNIYNFGPPSFFSCAKLAHILCLFCDGPPRQTKVYYVSQASICKHITPFKDFNFGLEV